MWAVHKCTTNIETRRGLHSLPLQDKLITAYGRGVGESADVTGMNVIAGTGINISNPLAVGDGTDVNGNNISDLVPI
jgi:hypothetical protein